MSIKYILTKGLLVFNRMKNAYDKVEINRNQFIRYSDMIIQAQENMIKELVNSKISDL